jgi:hypothetical protein
MDDLPEPLASVVEYLGANLDEGGREFIPTAELATALSIDRATLSRQMIGLGCRSTREASHRERHHSGRSAATSSLTSAPPLKPSRDGNLPDAEDDRAAQHACHTTPSQPPKHPSHRHCALLTTKLDKSGNRHTSRGSVTAQPLSTINKMSGDSKLSILFST